MNEQTIQFLRDLATQLGTTADKLWEVMVAQAAVVAHLNRVVALSLGIGFAVYWILVGIASWLIDEDMIDNEFLFGAAVIGIIVGIVILIAIPILLYGAAIASANPEYWALNEILRNF